MAAVPVPRLAAVSVVTVAFVLFSGGTRVGTAGSTSVIVIETPKLTNRPADATAARDLTDQLQEFLAEGLQDAVPCRQVVTSGDTKAILEQMRMEELSGGDDDAKAAASLESQALKALEEYQTPETRVRLTVGTLGSTGTADGAVIDVPTNRVIQRGIARWADAGQQEQQLRELGKRLGANEKFKCPKTPDAADADRQGSWIGIITERSHWAYDKTIGWERAQWKGKTLVTIDGRSTAAIGSREGISLHNTIRQKSGVKTCGDWTNNKVPWHQKFTETLSSFYNGSDATASLDVAIDRSGGTYHVTSSMGGNFTNTDHKVYDAEGTSDVFCKDDSINDHSDHSFKTEVYASEHPDGVGVYRPGAVALRGMRREDSAFLGDNDIRLTTITTWSVSFVPAPRDKGDRVERLAPVNKTR